MPRHLVSITLAVCCCLAIDAPSGFAQSTSEARKEPSKIVHGLAVSYGALQGLDVYTTRAALERGATESNPLMRPFAGNTAALTAVKAGAAAYTIWALERSSRRHRGAAIAGAVAVNALSAVVVAHNFSVLRRLPQ